MSSQTGVISYPVPPYANVPIHPEFYSPLRFNISNITRGVTTVVATDQDHDYVIGQEIRLIIPAIFGSYQLNEVRAYVIDIPSSTSVTLDFDSRFVDTFIPTPYTATITNISQALQATVTANNSFRLGNSIQFTSVGGMTQINTLVGQITAVNSSGFTVNINSSGFSAYSSGGVATLFNVPQTPAQIFSIGDINSGIISNTGNVNLTTNIPGSFINISPL